MTKDQSEAAQPLTEVLLAHAKGSVDAEAGEALRTLVAAVAQTEKKGSISVVVKVAPVPKSDGMVAMTAEVVAKILDHPPATSVWFADDGGNLSRQHPSQVSMFPDYPPTR